MIEKTCYKKDSQFSRSVSQSVVCFFEIPVKLTQTATPPPSKKTSLQASNTDLYLLIPCTPQPLHLPSKNFSTKKHGTVYQDLMSQIATGHQLKPRRIPQHSFDCLAMLLDESLVIWVCLKLKEKPPTSHASFSITVRSFIYTEFHMFFLGGEVILLPDALYEAFIC